MRTLSTAGQALLDRMLAGELIPVVQLVEALTTPTLRMAAAGRPLVWGGHTWGAIDLQIEPISHSAGGEVEQMQFRLPGVTPDQLALALTEPVDGKTVRVYDAWVDPDTGEVAEAVLAWAGTLNVPALQDGPQASVAWTAEHRGVQALRIKPLRYTDDEQRRLYPGDTSLNFDPATDAAPLAWPAASYFKQ